MKQYKVWISIEEIDEEKGHYKDMDLPQEAGCFDSLEKAQDLVDNIMLTEEASSKAIQHTFTLQEQSPDFPEKTVPLFLESEEGKFWIRPEGYGEKNATEGQGCPIGIEILQGRLRLVVFDDINKEYPHIIDLEKANESCRYCKAAEYLADQGKKIFTGPMNGGLWNARCLDAGILSGKEGDKAAYEFLIRYGDQYAKALSKDLNLQWLQIKNAAAKMLKTS